MDELLVVVNQERKSIVFDNLMAVSFDFVVKYDEFFERKGLRIDNFQQFFDEQFFIIGFMSGVLL